MRGGQDIHEALLQSATDAARTLRCKEISSRELTEVLLARIDSVNPALNAVVELRPEAALQEATTADEAITRDEEAVRLRVIPNFSETAFRVFILMASRRLKSDRFFTVDYTPRVYTPCAYTRARRSPIKVASAGRVNDFVR